MNKIEDILEFWFGTLTRDDAVPEERQKRWFRKSARFDRTVDKRFGKDVRAAVAGELDDWKSTARGTLALVLLLDQFTRNIFRNSPQAFACDAQAQALARHALERGLEAQLRPIERLFLLMPFMHAEDRDAQEQSMAHFGAEAATAPPALKGLAEGFAHSAARHADVVLRFGRFPHRNAILGRPSTPDEMEFLSQPHSGF